MKFETSGYNIVCFIWLATAGVALLAGKDLAFWGALVLANQADSLDKLSQIARTLKEKG